MNRFFGNKKAIALFILPAMVLFTALVFYPVLQVLFRSFYDWDGLGKGIFIGVDNYIKIFDDTIFKTAVKNGLIFAAIITVYQIGIGSILAFAVSNVRIKGRNFFRIVYFLPVVLSVTVVCQLWLNVFNTEFGLLNKLMEVVGIDFRQSWLDDRYKAIYVLAFVNAWHYVGYQFALLLAGIKSIPSTYYEAAKIDGASSFLAHIKITIPMLSETYKFCLVMSITGGLNAFTQMYIMTGGGPGTSTYTLTFLMYRSAFQTYQYGYGMTAATILVIECLVATILINKLIARKHITY
ncbi:MAG: sugar ABC transporter permease [Vallitaleaceae bacterium]|jgi:raffinose/stachyose/melibiose transport system permease protein|nr:sugar ABC transporter permease [Vallitaleaceae bacterium]